jgi:hypothetical protein
LRVDGAVSIDAGSDGAEMPSLQGRPIGDQLRSTARS